MGPYHRCTFDETSVCEHTARPEPSMTIALLIRRALPADVAVAQGQADGAAAAQGPAEGAQRRGGGSRPPGPLAARGPGHRHRRVGGRRRRADAARRVMRRNRTARTRVWSRRARWSTFADMAQGIRPERVGEEIRQELSTLLAREVQRSRHRLRHAHARRRSRPTCSSPASSTRISATRRRKRETAKALERATPFLRRQIGGRVRLRRVPELRFEFDESVEHQDRIERILLDLEAERERATPRRRAGRSRPRHPSDAADRRRPTTDPTDAET